MPQLSERVISITGLDGDGWEIFNLAREMKIIGAECYPNFGKSFLIGIMAAYLSKLNPEAKILVLEPTKCLAKVH